jgi:hypothetical protein
MSYLYVSKGYCWLLPFDWKNVMNVSVATLCWQKVNAFVINYTFKTSWWLRNHEGKKMINWKKMEWDLLIIYHGKYKEKC